MKTIKELEAENEYAISETFRIINFEKIKTLKGVLELIKVLQEEGYSIHSELKARITG